MERLDQLTKAIDRIEKRDAQTEVSGKIAQTQAGADGSLQIKDLSVLTPTGRHFSAAPHICSQQSCGGS